MQYPYHPRGLTRVLAEWLLLEFAFMIFFDHAKRQFFGIIHMVWQLMLTIILKPQIASLGHSIDHWFFVLVNFFNFKIFIPYRPRGYADSLRRVFDPIIRIDYFSFFEKFPHDPQGGSPAVLSVYWCNGFALMIFIFWKIIPHDPAFGSSNILIIRV